MSEFRFGYSGSPFGGIDELVDLAVRSEQSGFDTFVIADLPGGLSPLIALTAVAQRTSTIKLSPFVLNTGLWNPATIGRDLATLHLISGGRLEIALGSGIPRPNVSELMPSTRDARFERLVETVRMIKATFTDPGVTPGYGDSRPWMLIAGTSARVLELSALEADGFIIAGVPPVPRVSLPQGHLVLPNREETMIYLERLRGYAGARAASLDIGIGAAVLLTDDPEATKAELAAVHTYLTPEQVVASPKLLVGNVASVTDQIVERRANLGINYTVMRGAMPEELAPVLSVARTTP